MQVILISFIFVVNYVNGARYFGNLGDQIGDGKEWFRSDLQYINRVWQLDSDLQEKFNPFQPADNVWLKNIKQKPRADTTKPTIIKHWNKMIFNWEWESATYSKYQKEVLNLFFTKVIQK